MGISERSLATRAVSGPFQSCYIICKRVWEHSGLNLSGSVKRGQPISQCQQTLLSTDKGHLILGFEFLALGTGVAQICASQVIACQEGELEIRAKAPMGTETPIPLLVQPTPGGVSQTTGQVWTIWGPFLKESCGSRYETLCPILLRSCCPRPTLALGLQRTGQSHPWPVGQQVPKGDRRMEDPTGALPSMRMTGSVLLET